MSASDFSAPGGDGVAYAVNLGGGQIADYNVAGGFMGVVQDPSWNPSAFGGGGGGGSEN